MDQFGISRLGVIPMRGEASHKSEMVSQLLFGEHYKVIEYSADNEWVHIENHFDTYKGWIPSNQHNNITEEYFEQINESEYKICLDISSTILYQKSPVNIVMGSIIPISTNELFKMEEQLAFGGESKSVLVKREFEFIKTVGMKLLNTPYLWGGRSPYGIDCSGFVQLIFKVGGYRLARDSKDQALQGAEIQKFEEAAPGDLVFFSNDKGKVDHVAMLLEGDQVIHSSGKVRIDTISGEGIHHAETNQITHSNPSIRRVLEL